MNNNHTSFIQLCASNVQWALYGSTLFECIMLAHRTALFCTMPLQSYGLLVSTLSIVHLANHVADCGATNSIPPLLPYFTKSKGNFKNLMLWHTIMPHLPLVGIAIIATLAFTNVNPLLIAYLILTESVVAFLRQFLYTIQDTKATVIIQLGLLIIRVTCLWTLLLVYKFECSPELILCAYALETTACALFFVHRLRAFYRTLPEGAIDDSCNIRFFFFKTKFFNYLLRLSRNLFTTNFLTPFFALHFGLSSAGIFYFASKLAQFIVSVIKITIGYTGSGLLAASKTHSLEHTKKVFAMLASKLMNTSLPLVALFIISSPVLATYWYGEMITQKIVVLCALFLMLSISECFFILYESFYIIEHAASQLFVIKIAELAVFYGLIQIAHATSPATVLCGITIIRFTTLGIVAGLAYRRWEIAPAISQGLMPKQLLLPLQ